MRRTVRKDPRAEPASAPKPLLSSAERAELQRQGAKAAARGDSSQSNPLGQARNRPSATGESADKWLQRSDAWDQGHDAQSSSQQDAGQADSRGDVDEKP
jgi:hypothetical protein